MSSFDIKVCDSASNLRVVVEIDIGLNNEQWVNHGAGIWAVNPSNNYAWVDSSLVESGFSAQGFNPIGSVKIDSAVAQMGTSIEDLADTVMAWYYDGTTATLYITLPNFEEPALHSIAIGQTYAYSDHSFIPIGGPVPVEGRLLNIPNIQISRDPLFWGRLRFPATSVQLANGDGEFDMWGLDTDVYGNDCRVYVGFEDVDYSEWLQVYTGFMERAEVGEDRLTIGISDKRKQLTKPITYSCTNTNALSAIEEILLDEYGYTYDATFYDLTAWEAARTLVENVTIDMQEPDDAINVIELIASSVFGLFYVTPANKFSFKVSDSGATVKAFIPAHDVADAHSISYDPAEVVSSVRVGYARDWTATGASAYTYYTDTSREATVFSLYKTYNQRQFDTALPSLSAATAFASRVLDYVDTVRGTETVTVPLENYGLEIADQIALDIARGSRSMIGERKAEITGVELALQYPAMRLQLRYGGAPESMLTTDGGSVLLGGAEEILMEEAS